LRDFLKVKIIVFLIILFITTSSLIAQDNGDLDLSLEVDVPLQTYSPVVYYDGSQLGFQDTVLDTNNVPFDITKDGETSNFTIRIEGNEGSGKLLEVKIDGNFFTLSNAGTTTDNSNVFAYPVFIDQNSTNTTNDKSILYSIDIPLGPHDDKENVLEKQFKLIWKGNSQVPFGIYTCSIDINYTVI
jgi:hypothetical protein